MVRSHNKVKISMKGIGCIGSSVYILAILLFSLTAVEANASLLFNDNFEDGDYSGWLASWQQGQWSEAHGSWEVVSHNSSNMARIQHTTDGFHSLACDFTYVDESVLSFVMQVGGHTDGGNHAGGNATVSFLNNFNVELGSVSLIYSTNPGSVNPAYLIDSDQHHYSASMSEWASFAGLDNTDQVSNLSLAFVAWGQQDSWLQPGSEGTVWFDNVSVVPEPATLCMLGLGSLMLLGKRAGRGRDWENPSFRGNSRENCFEKEKS